MPIRTGLASTNGDSNPRTPRFPGLPLPRIACGGGGVGRVGVCSPKNNKAVVVSVHGGRWDLTDDDRARVQLFIVAVKPACQRPRTARSAERCEQDRGLRVPPQGVLADAPN